MYKIVGKISIFLQILPISLELIMLFGAGTIATYYNHANVLFVSLFLLTPTILLIKCMLIEIYGNNFTLILEDKYLNYISYNRNYKLAYKEIKKLKIFVNMGGRHGPKVLKVKCENKTFYISSSAITEKKLRKIVNILENKTGIQPL